MAKYFNYFPKTIYNLSNDSTAVQAVTNIVARYAFEQSFKDNSAVYYEYDVQDSDTPEIIASKLYGSPEKHWAILMFNDILDPQFDWPLDSRTIISYINEKYSANATGAQTGTQWAQANIHSYYKIQTREVANTNTKLEKKIQIDANTYANTAATTASVSLNDGNTVTIKVSKETKSYYDYEIELNESKRTIKLLRAEIVSSIEQELKRVFNFGI